VSTLKEAAVFFDAGFADILYAVCVDPHKLAAVRALRERGCALTVVVDSVAAAQAVVAHGMAHQHRFEVMIEVDTDGHRAGVLPDSDLLLQVGRTLHDGGAELKGVMTHAGASYECHTPEALQAMAEQERSRCVRAAERLRASGLPCSEVSVGSTPTAMSALQLNGVTEVRAGVYVFHDLVMLSLGVCTVDELALSVLTTVNVWPLGVEPLAGGLVDALVRVGTEEVALGLQQVGRQAGAAQAVVVRQRRAEGRHRDAVSHGQRHHLAPGCWLRLSTSLRKNGASIRFCSPGSAR
jgi:D-serine deaminase-like pyridoxal phosphate-dependent protein